MPNQRPYLNRRVLLSSRPNGPPTRDNFSLSEEKIPALQSGQVLLQTLWLSIEPYMALGMKGSIVSTPNPGRDRLLELCDRYVAGVPLNAVMCGPTISRVLESRRPEFSEGDLALAYSGWQEYAIDDGLTLRKIDVGPIPPQASLGVLGLPGMTAYVGMRNFGQPKQSETVVVSAALGPVGSLAGQIARMAGARVIGIASGAEKCRFLEKEFGFAAGVDRLAPDFEAQLARACPKGIDVYFENVGGAVWWAVFPLLNAFARVPVSGLASHYTIQAAHAAPDRTYEVMQKVQLQRMMFRGFSVFDHADEEASFIRDVSAWITSDQVRYKEDVEFGLEQAPDALLSVLAGRNRGKMIVKIAED